VRGVERGRERERGRGVENERERVIERGEGEGGREGEARRVRWGVTRIPKTRAYTTYCGVINPKSMVGKDAIVYNTLSKDRFAIQDRNVFAIS
jgi:hypothetical protein